MKCAYGIELPENPDKPCAKCGARRGDTCGRAYQAGFNDGVEAAIVALRDTRYDHMVDGSKTSLHRTREHAAAWLVENRPAEPL